MNTTSHTHPTPFVGQLIGSLTSPYVRKIRLLSAELALEYDWVLDDVWSSNPLVLQHNPLGQVPCLILPTGGVLTDSRAIEHYLLALATPSSPPPPLHHTENLLRWQALAEGIIDTAVKIRVEQLRPTALQSADWIQRQMSKLHASFTLINRHLQHHDWLANHQYSGADRSLQCGLNFIDFRLNDWDWRGEFTHLSTFEAKLAQQPHYRTTYPRLA